MSKKLSLLLCMFYLNVPDFSHANPPVTIKSKGDGFPEELRNMLVTNLSGFRNALAKAVPGDTIEVVDGRYILAGDLRITKSGQASLPITIRAKNLGQAVIDGHGEILFDAVEHVVMEGFKFIHSAPYRGWIFGNITLLNCHHVRLTRNTLQLTEDQPGPKGIQQWIAITGFQSHHNRIDHNLFNKKTLKGDFISVTGDGSGDEYVSQYDRIDHNHFRDFTYGRGENMYESIRVGSNRDGNNDVGSFLTVENNLFERCRGEIELLSFKCSDNYIYHNTFIDCYGAVSLRNGNRDIVAGNFFINRQKSEDSLGADGIMFWGAYHKIYNNYFENLHGCNMQSLRTFNSGIAMPGGGIAHGADALPATRVEMVFNTWVNCAELSLGYTTSGSPLPPQICLFANNIIYGNKDNGKLLSFHKIDGFTFCGNMVFPTGSAEAGVSGFNKSQFRIVDPKLIRSNGIWRLADMSSPAVNAAVQTCNHRKVQLLLEESKINSYPVISLPRDIDGQRRDDRPDVGADEFQLKPIVYRPLTPKDVGPYAP